MKQSTSIEEELRALEKQEARLLEERAKLYAEYERLKRLSEGLDSLVEESPYDNATELAIGLINYYRIDPTHLTEVSANARKPRKRVTPRIRDRVLSLLRNESMTQAQAAEACGVSQSVVFKINNGGYDHL